MQKIDCIPDDLCVRLNSEIQKQDEEKVSQFIEESYFTIPYITELHIKIFNSCTFLQDFIDTKPSEIKLLKGCYGLGLLLEMSSRLSIPITRLQLWKVCYTSFNVLRVTDYISLSELWRLKVKDIITQDVIAIFAWDCGRECAIGESIAASIENIHAEEKMLIDRLKVTISNSLESNLLTTFGIGKGYFPLRRLEESDKSVFMQKLRSLANDLVQLYSDVICEPDQKSLLLFFRTIVESHDRIGFSIVYLKCAVVPIITTIVELRNLCNDEIESMFGNSVNSNLICGLSPCNYLPLDVLNKSIKDYGVNCGDIVYYHIERNEVFAHSHNKKMKLDDGSSINTTDEVTESNIEVHGRADAGIVWLQNLANNVYINLFPKRNFDSQIVMRQSGLWKFALAQYRNLFDGELNMLRDKDLNEIQEGFARSLTVDRRYSTVQVYEIIAAFLKIDDYRRLRLYIKSSNQYQKLSFNLISISPNHSLNQFIETYETYQISVYYVVLPFVYCPGHRYFEINLVDERVKASRQRFLEKNLYPEAWKFYDQQVIGRNDISNAKKLLDMQRMFGNLSDDATLQVPDEYICDDKIYVSTPIHNFTVQDLLKAIRNQLDTRNDENFVANQHIKSRSPAGIYIFLVLSTINLLRWDLAQSVLPTSNEQRGLKDIGFKALEILSSPQLINPMSPQYSSNHSQFQDFLSEEVSDSSPEFLLNLFIIVQNIPDMPLNLYTPLRNLSPTWYVDVCVSILILLTIYQD